MTASVPAETRSAQSVFSAISTLCARAHRESSGAYFHLIEEMLPDRIAATAVADIRRLCRWTTDGAYSCFAYGQIDQMAKRLCEDDRLHLHR